MYQDFLDNELPQLLEDVSLEIQQSIWFQHGGCAAHYPVVTREIIRSELTRLFLWGYLKNKMYQEVPTTRETMIVRIRNTCADITRDVLSYVQSSETRIDACIAVQGYHFEYLLEE
ncbi:hypothetical protein Trydic_g9715 [Trypoxylus dichotomus]